MTLQSHPEMPKFLSRRNVLALMGIAAASSILPNRGLAAETAKLAWTPGASTPQIAVALQEKLWAAENLDVSAVSFPTGREALEALLGGGADFASLAEFPVVTAALRGQQFLVLASMSTFIGNRIVINAATGVKDIAGLSGKKVGVTLGTNMQFLAETVLKGVKVEYVNVAPGDLVPALSRGDVDAAFMFDTFYPQAKKVLGATYLEIMTPDYKGQFLLTASRAFADTNPAAVRAILAGLLKAEEKAADQAVAAKAVSAATGGTLSVEAIGLQWPNYHFEVGINSELLPLLMAEGAWINAKGLVKTPATESLLRGYIAKEALAALAPGRVSL